MLEALKTARVCVDPGHGGKDPGAVGPKGTHESTVVLAVGKELVYQLSLLGIDGYLTRDTEKTLELSDRTKAAKGADAFVSIHCNAVGDSRVTGVETIYNAPGGKGKALANCLQQAVKGESKDRGIKMSPSPGYPRSLYVLRMTECPAALVELEFISNEAQEAVLASEEGQKKLAYAVASGIASFLRSQGGYRVGPEEAEKPAPDVENSDPVAAELVAEAVAPPKKEKGSRRSRRA